MSIKILIADDHGVLRAGLRALLRMEPDLEVVGEADCGAEALRLAEELQPDVVVMDVSMPDMDGLEVTRCLERQRPGVRVLLLTVHEDPALLREALQAKASGYIVKRAVESELINAIRAVARGHLYIHPSLTRALLNQEPAAPARDESPSRLTPREIDVLQFIAKGHTNREIAELLHLSPRTVETHRANVRAKLHLDSRVELMRYAAKHGLLSFGGEGG
ncbi:MAG: response regulator transcription factor [Anaerolineae bacterium]|nr:response regulator transcription factor [Anaerolineae bacterium]